MEFSLSVSAELVHLPAIRRFIEETSLRLQVEREVIDELVQAVDESATNTITHGYRGSPGLIDIHIRLEAGYLIIQLVDHAPLFDPTQVPPADLTIPLEQRCRGGLGMHLVRCNTDQVTYRVTPDGGNELTLVKSVITSDIPQQAIDEFVAAAHGDLPTVQALLHREPRLVNAQASWGETGIQAAAQTGQKEIAEQLLASGAPLDICTAAMLGLDQDIQAFLTGDPRLVNAEGAHGLPVLYFPAITGRRTTARILLAHGADVNAGAGRQTPLHGAVFFNQAEMASWILEQGADPHLPDSKGRSALDLARALGRTQIAQILSQQG